MSGRDREAVFSHRREFYQRQRERETLEDREVRKENITGVRELL